MKLHDLSDLHLEFANFESSAVSCCAGPGTQQQTAASRINGLNAISSNDLERADHSRLNSRLSFSFELEFSALP